MDLSESQRIFAYNVSILISYIYKKNYSCTFGEAYRTPEQAEIYAKEGKGIVNSLHCKRLAIDLNLFDPDDNLLSQTKDYEFLGKFWETLHPQNRWGGKFNMRSDGNHFEMQE